MTNLFIIAGILIFIAVAIPLLESFIRGKRRAFQYTRKPCIMTAAERECFAALVAEMGFAYYFFPQVHLDSILSPNESRNNQFSAFRHINQKSVDFVACDKADLRPLFAIELDDKTHTQSKRIARDKEVERILGDAGIPLVRIQNRGRFDSKELAKTVQASLERVSPKAS